jgi:hypothetical protein
MIVEKLDKATFKIRFSFEVNFMSLESKKLIFLGVRFFLILFLAKGILNWLI